MIASDTEQVKSFWQQRAASNANDNEVTHSDVWQRWLEIETIKRFVTCADRVLDIGCGNGYTTMQIAPLVREIVGVDFCEEMIERAAGSVAQVGDNIANVTFSVGDVLNLGPEDFGRFDVVISGRCLINLSSWEDQTRAIGNIADVLEDGGRFLFIEGSQQGRERLNAFRESVGLEPMPPVWYNLDFDEQRTMAFLAKRFNLRQRVHLGVYDLIARVAHPLLVAPEQPQYKSYINEIAARLALNCQACPQIGRVMFLVLEKKSARNG